MQNWCSPGNAHMKEPFAWNLGKGCCNHAERGCCVDRWHHHPRTSARPYKWCLLMSISFLRVQWPYRIPWHTQNSHFSHNPLYASAAWCAVASNADAKTDKGRWGKTSGPRPFRWRCHYDTIKMITLISRDAPDLQVHRWVLNPPNCVMFGFASKNNNTEA